MRTLLFLVVLVLLPIQATLAYIPVRMEQAANTEAVPIDNPEEEQMFFGQLESAPHTFQITSETPFHMYVEVRVPDIDSSSNNVSGTVVRETKPGSVEEVARLRAKDAEWNRVYEKFEGDHYRVGSTFESELDAGTYFVEVSTPDNIEKYVLIIGREDAHQDIGYFEKVAKIADVKSFFEKTQLSVLGVATVYRPVILVGVLLVLILLFLRRRKRSV